MESTAEWKQVRVLDVLLSEFVCDCGEIKAFVKMLSTHRWVACIVGHRIYRSKHFTKCIEAQAWADQQLNNVTIQ